MLVLNRSAQNWDRLLRVPRHPDWSAAFLFRSSFQGAAFLVIMTLHTNQINGGVNLYSTGIPFRKGA